MTEIYGIGLDIAGRCQHYHQDEDVAALWCAECQRYYACYQCHDTLCDHYFVASKIGSLAVLCGVCRHRLTTDQYQLGRCPYCQQWFNPRCQRHYQIYFEE
ncbi:CHY zinc finger protein [Lactiplantibacillus herbarum]|uniref:CHY zinc finger protein n=1 Tax=Lactiplantibacillus herbarum TaxID=1670446 RepID=UPI0009E21885|nr:CHY zinc finger protein [Lactiplantibacillus herbarum]